METKGDEIIPFADERPVIALPSWQTAGNATWVDLGPWLHVWVCPVAGGWRAVLILGGIKTHGDTIYPDIRQAKIAALNAAVQEIGAVVPALTRLAMEV